ncbi:hypothetical protein [Spirillospora sp. NPDC029432]|uniref:hypothetical protein n=1 Tax=Spirillospora sp. NPDC029432 TaxID=3154599 RepID=UPI003455BCE7
MRTVARAPLCVAAAALAALLAAGCGGGGSGERPAAADPPPVPAGYTPVRAGKVVLAHPNGWTGVAQPPQGWLFGAELRAGETVEAQVAVIGKVPQVPVARLVADAASTGAEFNGAEVRRGGNRPVEIPGARDAVRVDYTYATAAGRPSDHLATDVSVVYGTGSAVVVRIAGLRSRLTPAMVDQVVRTIAIRA